VTVVLICGFLPMHVNPFPVNLHTVAHTVTSPKRVDASCIQVTFTQPSVALMNICTKIIQHSHMTIHLKDICAEELNYFIPIQLNPLPSNPFKYMQLKFPFDQCSWHCHCMDMSPSDTHQHLEVHRDHCGKSIINALWKLVS